LSTRLLSSQSLTTALQQSAVADAVAAGAALAPETPTTRSASEAAKAAGAILVQVRLVEIIVLVPAWNRNVRRTLSVSFSSVPNVGVLAVMPM
jgi:hypothetical protein